MRKLIALLATCIVMLVSNGSTPALASTTCQNGTQVCTTADHPVVAFAADHATAHASGVSTGAGGVTILVYTHFAFSEAKPLQQRGTCFWVKSAYNGGYWYGHKGFYYQLDHNLHVCKSATSPTGYIKIGGGITRADCHNPVKLIASPPAKQNIITGKVQWSSTFVYRATVTVTANASSTVRVSVSTHNADNSCQSSASASGTASATATATATATASSAASAISTATANASSQTHQSASVNASASAQASASSTAAAAAYCSPSSSPPPSYNAPGVSAQATSCDTAGHNPGIVSGTVSNPNGVADTAVVTIGSQSVTVSVPANGSIGFTMPNGYAPGTYTGSAYLQSAGTSASFQVTVAQCTPPQQTPPSITSMTTINDVGMGGTSPNFNVGTVVPLGHSGSLICSAQYGSFTPSTVSVSGMSTSTFTYVAPNDPTAPNGLTENVTCTVYDSVTGLSSMRSETFPINPRPAPPA